MPWHGDQGAIDDVEMGNLTGLLARIKPAITATKFDGEKSTKNAAYVDAVARTNVALTLDNIRPRSPILEDLEKRDPSRLPARCTTWPPAWCNLSARLLGHMCAGSVYTYFEKGIIR
jgi:hypothetical protein